MDNELKYDLSMERLNRFISNPKTALGKAFALIPDGVDVLDVGCHTGGFAAVLKKKGCRVTGIEKASRAAVKAEMVLDRVIVADIENEKVFEELTEQFDAILFLDVLEHCKYPERILNKVKRLLTAEGFVLSSIPNIAHWSVRKDLFLGNFEYRATGLLDQSHLRFFTIKTARELFEKVGYRIESLDFVLKAPKLCKQKIIPTTLAKCFPGFFCTQIVIKARLAGGEVVNVLVQ